MKTWTILIALSMSLYSTPSFACRSDTDCSVGSKCQIQRGKLKGMCSSGMNQVNDYNRSTYRDPRDIFGSSGDACTLDVDCGAGKYCAKEKDKIKGICYKH